MYIGVIFENHKYQKCVRINANDKEVAKRKLNAYVEHLNTQEGSSGTFTGEFNDSDDLDMITRLNYQ